MFLTRRAPKAIAPPLINGHDSNQINRLIESFNAARIDINGLSIFRTMLPLFVAGLRGNIRSNPAAVKKIPTDLLGMVKNYLV